VEAVEGRPVADARRWRLLLVGYVLVLCGILAAAYLGLVPTETARLPLFDTAGHFVLIGVAAALADGAWGYRRTLLRLFGATVALPTAALVVTAIAAVEELVQLLSPARTFDPVDLAADLGGALAFCWAFELMRRWRGARDSG
jgi:hypothetical protein